ncbi:hypothetical protein C2S53_020137 [Perilla frutescens var. hirtella]|uniref:Aminotransferase-like plant mobile domain-containing protein n=1 Tax=Perilla frutescens var. hirtella TaxID=608512 RepID=A0AAD4P3S5_PERFH|nr:hypothetical protein C2S53_020137 [Perilla frutescens var. hirtella]
MADKQQRREVPNKQAVSKRKSYTRQIVSETHSEATRKEKTKARNGSDGGKEHESDWQTSSQHQQSTEADMPSEHQTNRYDDSSEIKVSVEERNAGTDDDNYPTLKSRTCLSVLYKAIEKMNKKQKSDVMSIGFGPILLLKIKECPQKLSYWVLDNFDPKSCEITLQDGQRVHIDADDVSLILGFPRGPRPIGKEMRNVECPMTELWREHFQKRSDTILAKDVCKEMLSHREGGMWFKRLFIVLLTCCLIENSGNDLFPQIMSHLLVDVDNVADYDWCDYLLRCLVEHTLIWQKNKDKHFTGPILFLTLLYVDRVVLYRRVVPRSIPAINGWTYRLLCKRETAEIKSGGFGGGCPFGPCTDRDAGPNNGALPQPSQNQEAQDEVNVFVDKLLETAKLLAATMIKLISLVQEAPQKMWGTVRFRKMVEIAKKLVGNPTSSPFGVRQLFNTCGDDELWGNPHGIAAIEAIEKAIAKRNEFKKWMDDLPSFNKGITHGDGEFWDNPDRIAAIKEIENAVAKRNEFKKWIDDLPSFNIGLTGEVKDSSSMSPETLMK